jgi:GH25 family lysozyme M1 (1,4-beta-N-acetylmuramidase)
MASPFPDLSNWQNGSDLVGILRALGSDRVLLKASEGLTADLSFPGFVRQAIGLDKKIGAYHFARPSAHDGTTEASFHTAVLRGVFGPSINLARTWSCYDMEDPRLDQKSAGAASTAKLHAILFAQQMVKSGWTRGVIYASAPYITWSGLWPSDLPEGWRFLHIANYNATPDEQIPLPPQWSRSQVVARQFTSSAVVSGATTALDISHIDAEWLETARGGTVSVQDVNDALNQPRALAEGFTDWRDQLARKPDGLIEMVRAIYNQLGLNIDQGVVASNQQVGLVGAAVGAARADIALILTALTTLPQAQIDYDLLADKVVDRLAARLVAGAPPAVMVPHNPWPNTTPMPQDATPLGDEAERTAEILLPRRPGTPPPGEMYAHQDGTLCPHPVQTPATGPDGHYPIVDCGCGKENDGS